ncbi:MAG: hypothetical protein JF609_00315 [Verrucomicrobia bacterium]|nr:hypothetical protein [Verrucomicrobiota bacterium]
MALVITLIMLSVTLIMAIAFLAVARRERISVSTSTDTTVARFASDNALAAAQAQIIGNLLSTNTAFYDYNLLVSTNYINANGFDIAALPSPNNVSYNYPNGNLIAGPDFDRNVANLLFLPRAPVMVSASEPAGRFYLDLNRSGAFEDTGDLNYTIDAFGVTNRILSPAAPYTTVGDPQWVGILDRPGAPHGPDNLFTSRYAFIALPVGESLDVNAMHNYVKRVVAKPQLMPLGADSYMRNQGVGSWELNLAAFLSDLNTNQWLGYNYALDSFGLPSLTQANGGNAFDDSLALLRYRYNFNLFNQAPANLMFPPVSAGNILPRDNVDAYSDGPIQFTTSNIVESLLPDDPTRPWAGAANTNRFFTPGDLYDRTKTQVGIAANVFGFSDRLNNAGTNTFGNANKVVPTYDAYTFYRMLDQLGTDTLPDTGRLNLNYSNAVVTYSNGIFVSATIIPGAETNLVPWISSNFFCAAADLLLKTYTTNWFQANPQNYLATYFATNFTYNYVNVRGTSVTNDPSGFGLSIPVLNIQNQIPAFGLGHIPVLINGQFVYSPAVNRLVQLAANIYDA